MAKLATLAAILGVLLAVSHAVSASRATITTVDIDEAENQRRGGGRSCYEQVERQDLNHCEQLFEDVMRYGGGRYGGDQYGRGQYGGDQYGDDRYGQGSGRWGGQGQCSSQQLRQSRHFRPCCQQLRQLDDQCRCEGLREIVREQTGGFGGQGSQGQLSQCARNLPNICGFGPQHCEIRGMGYLRQ
ncbi:2S albumin-like [Eucalyptus grandis]|uniref:2S albumin-like n=1 Tax=Eucalyptus grandis TaxID=71139 RepID=UPI00192ED674|nr:2S albumin-like [Eucalyptus grandis]